MLQLLPGLHEELFAGSDRSQVEAVWSFFAPSAVVHRVLPDGCMYLFASFRLHKDFVQDVELSIAGPSQSYLLLPVEAGRGFLGLRFDPAWGGACVGVSPRELRNQSVDDASVDRLIGPSAIVLRRARTLSELRSGLIWVARHCADLGRGRPPYGGRVAAVEALKESHGRRAIREIAADLGLPYRTFSRAVLETTGMSAKALASVMRFQSAVRRLQTLKPGRSLAETAFELGFADQSHMTRELRRLGGLTPARARAASRSPTATSFKTASER